MRPQNPYYQQCKYLKYIYPKTSNINCQKVVAWCEKFMINIYSIKNPDGTQKIMSCVNNSPYFTKSTCKGFKSKLGHTQGKLI